MRRRLSRWLMYWSSLLHDLAIWIEHPELHNDGGSWAEQRDQRLADPEAQAAYDEARTQHNDGYPIKSPPEEVQS